MDDGWRTALPTPARTRDGQPIQIVFGLVETENGPQTAVRIGDGRTALIADDDELQLMSRLRYLIAQKLRRRGDL